MEIPGRGGPAILTRMVRVPLAQVLRRIASVSVGLAFAAAPAAADELELSIQEGRVTIRAEHVSVKTILAEWGRVGQTAIIDADGLVDKIVTLELVNVPEEQALRTLLRDAAGFLAAPRAVVSGGSSRFDRILVLADSKSAPPRQPFARRGTRPAPFEPDAGSDALREPGAPPSPDENALMALAASGRVDQLIVALEDTNPVAQSTAANLLHGLNPEAGGTAAIDTVQDMHLLTSVFSDPSADLFSGPFNFGASSVTSRNSRDYVGFTGNYFAGTHSGIPVGNRDNNLSRFDHP